MKYFLLALTGAVSGILGGMGMGGGTLLIPALTIFFKLDQHFAQTINLISFIPMAIVALIIHVKNKMIKKQGVFAIAVVALIFSIGASFLVKLISGNLQTKLFGIFLIALAVVQFFTVKKTGREKGKKSS